MFSALSSLYLYQMQYITKQIHKNTTSVWLAYHYIWYQKYALAEKKWFTASSFTVCSQLPISYLFMGLGSQNQALCNMWNGHMYFLNTYRNEDCIMGTRSSVLKISKIPPAQCTQHKKQSQTVHITTFLVLQQKV